MATSGTTRDNERQRVATSDNKWQWVTTIGSEWQQVVVLANFLFSRIRGEPNAP